MAEQQESPIRLIVNSFHKGEVTDIDPTRQSNEFFEEANNVRIMNHQGHGLVITNIKGNSYSVSSGNNNLGFELTDGFVPLGGCVYNGILFLASCYKTRVNNQDYAIGELGCYPSLNSSGDWVREYSPLQNWNEDGLGTDGDFKTAYLKFHIDKPIEMVPWETADGSINLYITDGEEPLRVFNCGFNMDGETNSIVYTADHFPNAVNLIMSSNNPLEITHQNTTDSYVQSGGALPYGNMFFFFRYADPNLNYTYFVGESRPCQIYRGEATVGAAHGDIEGTSNKKVAFHLDNLDSAYSYIQVGYIRYFSGEDGVSTFEVAMVDKDYPLPTDVSSGLDIEITGTEGTRVLDINELVENRDIDDTCESFVPVESRLWGANWKSITHHHQSLLDFALKVTVDVDVTKTFDATVHEPSELLSNDKGEYKVTNFVSDYVGYFRTEAYPFALRFELNNGYLSAPYPIQGKDFWQVGTPTNNYGLVRFPAGTEAGYEVFREIGGVDSVRVMGISFDFSTALQDTLDNNDPSDLGWIKENVRAIHIVRGERKKTLEYQGLGVLGATARLPNDNTVDLNITKTCSMGTSITDHVFHNQYDTNTLADPSDYYTQRRQDYAEKVSPGNRQDEYWGAEALEYDVHLSADEEYYRDDVYVPLFRGYAPHHFAGGNVLEKSKDRNRNYMVRYFLKKNKLAVFSPDLIFGGPTTLPDIKLLKSQAKTLPTYTVWNGAASMPVTGDAWTLGEALTTAFSDIYPRVYSAEMGAPTVAGTKSETNFTSTSLLRWGEWNTPMTSKDLFVNRTKDLYSSDFDAMYYAVNNKMSWTSRAMKFTDYIGITLDDASQTADDNWNLDIINLYNRADPQSDDITSYFSNLSSVKYHEIGSIIPTDWDALDDLADLTSYEAMVYYGGDCFIQRSYFKIQGWSGTSFNQEGYDDEDPESIDLYDNPEGTDKSRFTHGLLVSIVTENAVNIAMRGTDKLKSFYPKVSDKKTVAITPETPEKGESRLLNSGYSRIISPKFAFGYSSIFPTSDKRKRARIRFSDKNSSESFVDGFRKFRADNFRDFEVNKGSIKKVVEIHGYLVSIQENSINLHYINERQTRSDPDSGRIVFATGEILSPKWRTLSDYGSQHRTSIVRGLQGFYGIDFYRRKVWALRLSNTGPAVVDLATTLYNSKSIQELFSRWSLRGDIVQKLPDSPMTGFGIVGVFDPKYDEVYFVFVNQVETEPKGLLHQTV